MHAASAARRLRVDHREAEVELAAPVELAVGVDDVRAGRRSGVGSAKLPGAAGP
jgi:hypothetical protein